MDTELTYNDEDRYLLVKVKGPWDQADVENQIGLLRPEVESHGYTHILIDIRELLPPERELNRFFAGERIAEHWRHPLKVAVLGLPEMINRFAETVARNRGANFQVFKDREEALRWLLG